MPYPELKGILTDVGTSGNSVLHLETQADKPNNAGILMFTLHSDERFTPYRQDKQPIIKKGCKERIIRVYIGVSDC